MAREGDGVPVCALFWRLSVVTLNAGLSPGLSPTVPFVIVWTMTRPTGISTNNTGTLDAFLSNPLGRYKPVLPSWSFDVLTMRADVSNAWEQQANRQDPIG